MDESLVVWWHHKTREEVYTFYTSASHPISLKELFGANWMEMSFVQFLSCERQNIEIMQELEPDIPMLGGDEPPVVSTNLEEDFDLRIEIIFRTASETDLAQTDLLAKRKDNLEWEDWLEEALQDESEYITDQNSSEDYLDSVFMLSQPPGADFDYCENIVHDMEFFTATTEPHLGSVYVTNAVKTNTPQLLLSSEFAWLAGFLIGVGLMLMVPYYLDGFDSAFRFTSAAGWFVGSFIMMYGDREPYSGYLNKLGW